ncbi:TetR/AcrR family transcriptional regulator [Streptomyces virginiae]|uniref:TetR/AcrR family transcriptional regulator n=1 Tax=Streptomyces virginiae TaxID=1961 RepID=UPI003629E303
MTRHPNRARIVAAALPLVVKHGTSVTTSMIARAAGVPTPAVFNAFPDKAALLNACATEAGRRDETVAALTAISLSQPLPARLTAAATALRSYATRMHLLADTTPRTQPWPPGRPTDHASRQMQHEGNLSWFQEAVTALFEPERDHLRIPPERLAGVFQAMILATALSGPAQLPIEELVSVVLWGALPSP